MFWDMTSAIKGPQLSLQLLIGSSSVFYSFSAALDQNSYINHYKIPDIKSQHGW